MLYAALCAALWELPFKGRHVLKEKAIQQLD